MRSVIFENKTTDVKSLNIFKGKLTASSIYQLFRGNQQGGVKFTPHTSTPRLNSVSVL